MTALQMLVMLLLALALHCARAHQRLSKYELLRASRSHGMCVELRRRALISRIVDDLQEFPQPREFRVVVWRLAGMVVRSDEHSAALPQHFDAVIHQLRAEDTDHLFSAGHQLGGRRTIAA